MDRQMLDDRKMLDECNMAFFPYEVDFMMNEKPIPLVREGICREEKTRIQNCLLDSMFKAGDAFRSLAGILNFPARDASISAICNSGLGACVTKMALQEQTHYNVSRKRISLMILTEWVEEIRARYAVSVAQEDPQADQNYKETLMSLFGTGPGGPNVNLLKRCDDRLTLRERKRKAQEAKLDAPSSSGEAGPSSSSGM